MRLYLKAAVRSTQRSGRSRGAREGPRILSPMEAYFHELMGIREAILLPDWNSLHRLLQIERAVCVLPVHAPRGTNSTAKREMIE